MKLQSVEYRSSQQTPSCNLHKHPPPKKQTNPASKQAQVHAEMASFFKKNHETPCFLHISEVLSDNVVSNIPESYRELPSAEKMHEKYAYECVPAWKGTACDSLNMNSFEDIALYFLVES